MKNTVGKGKIIIGAIFIVAAVVCLVRFFVIL